MVTGGKCCLHALWFGKICIV